MALHTCGEEARTDPALRCNSAPSKERDKRLAGMVGLVISSSDALQEFHLQGRGGRPGRDWRARGALGLPDLLSRCAQWAPGATEKPATSTELVQAQASFKALCARRPDWIDADLVNPLLAALKLTERTNDQTAVVRDAVAAASTVKQIVSLLPVVADRGDVDLLLRLFAGLDGRSWAVVGPRAYPGDEISVALMKAIDARAKASTFTEVGRIIEAVLDSARLRSRNARSSSGGGLRPLTIRSVLRCSMSALINAPWRWSFQRRARFLTAARSWFSAMRSCFTSAPSGSKSFLLSPRSPGARRARRPRV